MVGDPCDPVRAALPDDESEQAATVGWFTDRTAYLRIDSAGDEPLDVSAGIDDAQGGIVRAHEPTDPIDDELQDGLEFEDLRDRPSRIDEGLELIDAQSGAGRGLGWDGWSGLHHAANLPVPPLGIPR